MKIPVIHPILCSKVTVSLTPVSVMINESIQPYKSNTP